MIKKIVMSMMAIMMIASAVALADGNTKSKAGCTDKPGCCMIKATADNGATPATCDVKTCVEKPGCVCPQKASASNTNGSIAACDPKTCVNKPGCGTK